MKKLLLLFLAAMSFFACSVSISKRLPEEAVKILSNIKAPEFRNVDYSIVDFGAVPDTLVDSRKAINDAITLCSDEGGGRVVVPAGFWACNGPIVLKSNVNLHVSEGAVIIFSENPSDYLPAVLTMWEGTEMYNYSPLVYAYHCNNVALTGKGTLDGNATNGFAKMRPQKSEQQNQLRQMGVDLVPIRDRYFGAESIMPPSMVQPFGCKNVLIEGVTLLDSPFWVIHPVYCDNVTVRGVTIDSWNLNNDGCDPDRTTNVLIEECNFHTGDDAIAIKAGMNQDAWSAGQKTANIIVRNCRFSSLCNGLCIGSDMSGGVHNVYMYDCIIDKCFSAIYFKSNLDRGAFIRDVWVDNVACNEVWTAFIRFETNYHSHRGGFYPTIFENFEISNVTGNKSARYGITAIGIKDYEMRNIHLNNVNLADCPTPYVLKNTKNVVFDKVTINGELMPRIPENTDKEIGKLGSF